MAIVLSERKPFLLLLVLLTLNLILMSSSVKNVERRSLLEEAVVSIASPFLKTAAWIGRGTAGTWSSYADLRGVAKENRRLHEQVDSLALQAREAEEARLELERLRDILDLRGQVDRPAAAARVIARDESGGARIVLLDRGTHDGLAPNDPVITPRGVVRMLIPRPPSTRGTLFEPT